MGIDKEKFKIEPDKDDEMSVLTLAEHLNDDSERKKNLLAAEINELGTQYLQEIDRKKKIKRIRQSKLIPYILKNSDDQYTEEELLSYSFEDVMKIHDDIKTKKRSWIVKLFEFFSSNQ